MASRPTDPRPGHGRAASALLSLDAPEQRERFRLAEERAERERQHRAYQDWDRRQKADLFDKAQAAFMGEGTYTERVKAALQILGWNKRTAIPPAMLLMDYGLFCQIHDRETAIEIMKERFNANSREAMIKQLQDARSWLSRARKRTPGNSYLAELDRDLKPIPSRAYSRQTRRIPSKSD